MSKFQLFDAVSLTEPIAQNILFHCGTGETPVHHLRLKYSLTTKSALASQRWEWMLNKVKILIGNKKTDRPNHHPNQLLA
ncbi:hypothetical protein QUB70_16525 [Microcoleus sp. A003_D6]|uniref:hypothetical protein n=1 Tax=Microcoleus sp. A003_D6 TaxID=3055266 RepID=UPI002FD40229